MILNKVRKQQLALICVVVAYVFIKEAEALTEEIEATPTNTNGFEIGELSMPQYVLMMLIFLKLVLLYAVGVLPLEIDLGSVWYGTSFDSDDYNYDDYEDDTFARRSGRALEYKNATLTNSKMSSLNPIMWDCPLQFVCEVDQWTNRDHDTFFESYLASWLRNAKNNTFNSEKGRTFGGVPETCPEMYPCPFDIQEVVGIKIPGSQLQHLARDDHPDPDGYISLY